MASAQVQVPVVGVVLSRSDAGGLPHNVVRVSWTKATPIRLHGGFRCPLSELASCASNRKVALRDSHLLPKAGYRLLTKSVGGDAPIVLNSKVAIATNEQVGGHVFCEKCEDLLNKNGEAWTLKHCFRENHGFALREVLDAEPPEFDSGSGLKVWFGAKIPSIDKDQLIYFASSIFWRISIHEWKSGNKAILRPQLGGTYESEFREFL